MAKSTSVWGIEIGQSALKALRCKLEGDQVVAEAFDYIEYPKILSQPDADAETLVREALETFVGRNDLKHCRVALTTAGQNGLAKFFKPPPVELKKIPDIVKYEARQQIPFDLNDVVWDYQLMPGSNISDGFALESEVGLFAMKRDAVYRALRPLQEVGVEVDLLQLAPLAIYNMVTYDRHMIEEDYVYDPDHPPKWNMVLAMGADSTDLILTNGYRVWQRSMPLGGNHFTRQITKQLQLTFAKAEHLKRNVMEADDPKLVFQAMRPVFNDLVTEVQRSKGFFSSLNKKAEIGSVLMLGNSVKLPGLAQFLSKNLAMDVEVLDHFNELQGDDVLNAPAFKDHLTSFVPVFGACLELLGKGPVTTNLVPREVVKERIVRAKKPWAVVTAAALLIGFAGHLIADAGRYGRVHEELWKDAMAAAETTKSTSDAAISEDAALVNMVELLQKIGEEVSGSADRRLLWMELIYALFDALNRPQDFDLKALPDPKEVPYNQRTDLFITKMDCKFYDDISTYVEKVKNKYLEDKKSREIRLGLIKPEELGEEGAATDTATAAEEEQLGPVAAEGEEGNKAWVIQLNGYHYHNGREYAATGDELEDFVLKTLIHEIETGSVELPVGPNGETMEFTFKELGLSMPFVLRGTYDPDFKIPNPKYKPSAASMGGYGGPGMGPGMGSGGPGMGPGGLGGDGPGAGPGAGSGAGGTPDVDENGEPRFFPAPKYTFVVQMIWKETPLTQRLAARRKAAEEAAAAAEAAGEAGEALDGEQGDDQPPPAGEEGVAGAPVGAGEPAL
ncbi:MAG: pilus assembly protein PilM [Planctomycetota bacterium]|nr:MAG: pilus assembly protein PilM [Planctomycetota bacterium]